MSTILLLLEDVSFNAGGDSMPEVRLEITPEYVKNHVKAAKEADIKKYIL